jgi:hypothetical protein
MASYTRQSSFADGDTITAALFNNEFNQLVNALHNSTGHKHDGTAAEGPVIGLIGDAGETAPNNKVLIDTVNNFVEFYVQVASAPVQQLYIADGAIIPVTDSDIDLGTSSLYFKNAYIDSITTTGNVAVGGNLTVTGTTTFNGGTITMGDAATDNVVFGADVDSNIIPDDDDTYDLGSASQEWRNLYIDGTANIDSLVADTADINAGTIDGATIATSDITVGAGKTLDVSAGTLTLADNQISGDKVEGGTINATTITTLASTTGNITTVNATTVDSTNLEVTNLKAKDGTAAGSIADTTGVVTLASSVLTTADINGGTIDGSTIATSDITVGASKTLDVSAGTLTLADNQISGDKVEGGTIAATTITDLTFGSLNDGTITATAFVDEDNMASDSATLIPTQQSVKAYVDSQVTAQDLDFQGDTGGALSIDLDSEALTIAGGTGLDTVGSGNTVTVNIDSTVATLTGSQTLTNKTLTSPVINTGVSGTAVLDDDTFATASATTLATSESIKAYVDTQITAEDLDLTTDSGTIAIDLDSETLSILGGTGLDSSATGNAVTLAIDSTVATLTGTQTLTNKTIDAASNTLSNIANGSLTNSTVSYGGVSLALGASDATPAFDLTDATNYPTSSLTGTITNAQLAGSIEVSKTLLAGGTGLTLSTNTLSVDAAQTQITSVGTLGSLTVTGDLTVDTSTLKVDSTNNRVGILDATPAVSLDAGSATDAFFVPKGTTAQRPTGVDGYFRYNTDDAQFEGYADGEWGAIAGSGSGSAIEPQIFAGDGSTVNFTLTSAPTSENNLLVFIDGVFQAHDSYSVSGTTLTFSTAPANTRVVTVYHARSNVSGANMIVDTMTGDNSDTTLTLSVAPVSVNNVQVYFDGVYQNKANYSISGTTLTFSTAPATGVAVEAITHTQTTINEPANGTVTSAKLDTNIAIAGTLGVTGVLTGTSLDISGDIDVDGTTNLDVVDIDGAVDMASTLTVTGAITGSSAAFTQTNTLVSPVSARYNAANKKIAFNINNSNGQGFIASNSNSTNASGNQTYDITNTAAKIDFGSGITIDTAVSGSAGGTITYVNNAEFLPTGIIFNEGGIDADFRVESDNNTHALFVQGSDGNVGIGTSTPVASGVSALQVGVRTVLSQVVSNQTLLGDNCYYTGSDWKSIVDSPFHAVRLQNGKIDFHIGTSVGAGGTTITDMDTTALKMTIDSSGFLNIASGSKTGRINMQPNPANNHFFEFYNTADVKCGEINTADGTQTNYVTSSDYRLKEDDQPMTGATERVKALRPINFAWKVNGSRVDGFLAHEVQEIVPEAITGTKDAMQDEEYEVTPAVLDDDGNVVTEAVMGTRSVPDYQGIDQSKLVPLLVKTIQELEARITTLENA